MNSSSCPGCFPYIIMSVFVSHHVKLLTLERNANRMLRTLLIGSFILLNITAIQAQWMSQRCRWIKIINRPVSLDTLSIQPGSFQIVSPVDSSISVLYDVNQNQITIQTTQSIDSVFLCYKVFPFDFSQSFYHRKRSEYDSTYYFDSNLLVTQLPEKKEQLLITPGIQKTGSITRGISVGNTQNVFVNSALNLQLEGKLNEDVSIIATISDQNIPFQPEGNTQQLQDFDRVFIQLRTKIANLTVGDIVFQNKPSQFLRYYKNVQGALLEVNYKKNESISSQTTVGASLSKGKFASISVAPLEGVQGPYRLNGPSNETFIMIIANSEKVFLDGRLLKRGYNLDYTIDYNQAEIVFTNRVLITQFSRIRVDFEYVERNYNRTILTANHYQQVGKFSFFGNLYSQRDNPNSPLGISLSDADKILLQKIGDSTQFAFASGVTDIGYSPDIIVYRQVDTVTTQGTFRVYVYSTDPEKAIYNVVFTELGQGKGNYIIASTSTANGRVYKWIAPIDGIPQGSYEPVKRIPLPQKNEMYTFGTSYNFNRNQQVFIEGALSQNDVNLFSRIDDQNNIGKAIKIGYQNKGDTLRWLSNYRWIAGVDYEFDDARFKPIDRFRYIEFERDWSATSISTIPLEENIFNAQLGIEKNTLNRINYGFSRRLRGSQVNGYQHRAELSQEWRKFFLQSSFFNMQNQSEAFDSKWNRFRANVGMNLSAITYGYIYGLDKNEILKTNTDSVISTAMNFDEHQLYLRSRDSVGLRYNASYAFRYDYLPIDYVLQRATKSNTAQVGFGKTFTTNGNLEINLTYRKLQNLLPGISEQTPEEETFMGRIDWNAYFLTKSIRSELTFYTFTGRELKRSFVYLPVAVGKGTYTWRDDNDDGVQDLNEFYEAINPDEKTYIKVFIPTNEYVPAYGSNFTYRLTINAPTRWVRGSGFKKTLAKFSNISSWAIEKKTTDSDPVKRFLPINNIANEDLLAVKELLKSTLFFNRTNSTYGGDISLNVLQQKNLLTNGFESRYTREYKWNARVNVSPSFNLRSWITQFGLISESDFLIAKNFALDGYRFSPELSWQPLSSFRISGGYVYGQKKSEQQRALSNEFNLDIRWSTVSQKTVTALFRFINIQYEGDINTPLGYEMLEALQPGRNITWTVNWVQKLFNGLQLTVSYEGRGSQGKQFVHIGRMQLAALF